MATDTRTHDDYTVGWICAISKELTAATAMLDHRHADLPKPPSDQNTYTLGSIGSHNIVIACLPKGKPGTNSAATIVTQMVNTFPSIKFGLLVGIGSGIPPKVRLGDVVVSTPTAQYPGVVQYDMGKVKEGKFERIGSLNHPPKSLLTALTKLETENDLEGSRIPEYLEELKAKYPRLALKYSKPDSLKDVLFRANYSHIHKCDTYGYSIQDGDEGFDDENPCRDCDKAQIIKRQPREMLVHYGLIASGNQLVADAAIRDKIRKELDGNVLCIEMEAAGLMDSFPCVVIRGICDYADSHNSEIWQKHAAAIAAAYAKELLGYVQPYDIDGERKVKDILNELSNVVSTTGEYVTRIKTQLDNKEDAEVLDWLTSLDYGPQQSDFLKRQQPGTGQWLLDSTEYQTWVSTKNKTLFCPGIPGAGKTILTSIVVNDLETKFECDPAVRIAYIYCNFRRQNEQKIEDMMCSLTKQLFYSGTTLPLPGFLKDLYARHKMKRTRPLLDEIRKTLQLVASLCPRLFIIIDALDEISGVCRNQFLSELFSLQAATQASIFATSRFIPEITERFTSLVLEIRASGDDICRYLDGHISRLPGFVDRDSVLQEEIKASIVTAVDGMFLLAQLHLDSLQGKRSPRAVRNTLQILAHGTDAYDIAYEAAMERIQHQIQDRKELAEQVLSWIVFGVRPLTVLELRYALAVEVGEPELYEDNLPDIADMVSVCAGLVTVDEESNIIRLVHYTAQQYFERKESLFPNAQLTITNTCTTYLSFQTFESGFAQSDGEFIARLESNPFYDYAAHNWGYHAHHVPNCGNTILFLKRTAHVEASSQALLALWQYRFIGYFSQRPPQRMTGLHLASYFGLVGEVQALCDGHGGFDVDIRNSYDQTPIWSAATNGHGAIVQLLIGRGAQVDAKDMYHRTPLSEATKHGHEAVAQLLIDRGAEVDAKDTQGWTPLFGAVENGHEAIIRLLLERGAEADAKDTHRRTPLLLAAKHGHKAVVQLLLDRGAEVDTRQLRSGRTPLSWAAGEGHEAVVQNLLDRGAEVDSKDTDDRTPLSWAAGNGHEAIVQLLLDRGAEVDPRDTGNRTPLSWAGIYGHETLIQLLLDTGVEIDAKDKHGRTPCMLAAMSGNKAAVQLLLDRGAEIESKDTKDYRPLLCAARIGHEAVVQLLLDRGADFDAKDVDDRTPLSLAAGKGYEAVVQNLLDRGAEVDSKDTDDRTPLSWAAGNGHEAIVQLLLDRGADIDAKGTDDQTPLSWAAMNRHEAVVQLLLDKGAEVDVRDKNGRTPLLLVTQASYHPNPTIVQNGHEAVVQLLLDRGADIDARDEYDRTPLLLATLNGYETVVQLLLDRGAKINAKDTRFGRTPLFWAAYIGREPIIQVLLDRGAEVNIKDTQGNTLLLQATENGHESIIQLLPAKGTKYHAREYRINRL